MRDIVMMLCGVGGVVAAFRYPYVGMMFWVWLSLESPQQETYSFANVVPWVFITAAVATLAWLMSAERKAPPKGIIVPLVLLLLAWTTLNTAVGFDPSYSWPYWNRTWKTIAMCVVVGSMARTRVRTHALMWVVALAIGYFGVKGGIFTLLSGGKYRVWGPPNSMIGDNNELALALVMILPILNYLRLHSGARFVRVGIVIAIILCLASILGSYSREAYIALGVLGVAFWLRTKNKVAFMVFAAVALVPLLHFMPESFYLRLNSIHSYNTDSSFQSRLESWRLAYLYASSHVPFGAGFYAFNLKSLWAIYVPEGVHAVHSIYFQTLGEQGIVGLALYLMIIAATILNLRAVIRNTRGLPTLGWANDLARMMQVSLYSFLVGGAAAPMNFFDLLFLWVLMSASLRQHGTALDESTHAPGAIVANSEAAPISAARR